MTRHLHIDPLGEVHGAQWLGLLIDLRASQEVLERAVGQVDSSVRTVVTEASLDGTRATQVSIETAGGDGSGVPARELLADVALGERARARALAAAGRLGDGADVAEACTIAGACAMLDELDIETLSAPESLPRGAAPDAAALTASLCDRVGSHPGLTIDRYGYGARPGAGPERERLLRGWVGERLAPLVRLEATVSGSAADQLSYALARAGDAGAVDAWLEPVTMSGGRLVTRLIALCETDREGDVRAVILRETPALTILGAIVERTSARHTSQLVKTPFGEVSVRRKADWLEPDAEACAALASQHGVPVHRVLEAAKHAARRADPRASTKPPPGGGPTGEVAG